MTSLVRKAPQVLALTGLLVLTIARPSRAEWQFTPFVGYTFKGATTLLDFELGSEQTHWNFGGVVTFIGDSPFGVEAYFVRTPGFFENDEVVCPIETCNTSSRTYAVMGNAVLATPRHWNQYGLRPYLSGGVGLLHASRSTALNVFPIDLNLLGMNLGGGAVGFLSDRVGLRFDLRYFRKVQGPDEDELEGPVAIGPIRLRYWTGSLGVVIRY
ncbi:MAG: hypothetical protein ACRD15_19730 [Vicinamibacterales bacterium]